MTTIDRKYVPAELENIQAFFEARADMAVGAGKTRLLAYANAVRDALELLKEQEAVKPIKPRGSASWICGVCKTAIGTSLIYHFCPWCGRRVKLE